MCTDWKEVYAQLAKMSHPEVKSQGDSSMTWKANSNSTMTKIETVNPALY
jgi:hypothetical protein